MKANNEDRNARILELRHTMTQTQIMQHMGLSRSVIAGVFFRADHPRQHQPRVRAVTDAALGKAARRAGLTIKDIHAIGQERRAAE